MSKIVDDIKTGLKGIRGAGDAIRGEVLEATDQAFDNNQNHPETRASQAKNRVVAEKGKQDLRSVDDMLARREWEHKGVTGADGGASAHHRTDADASNAPASAVAGNSAQRAA
ncbi:hypothetical protein F4776DRAFT_475378 [Hypoxylon sp. NC0597]|nr:hypothetical protein F4776DRAFT_475378 [Hypoxylon sp. NC0597]